MTAKKFVENLIKLHAVGDTYDELVHKLSKVTYCTPWRF
jgi:hypothetical protein